MKMISEILMRATIEAKVTIFELFLYNHLILLFDIAKERVLIILHSYLIS